MGHHFLDTQYVQEVVIDGICLYKIYHISIVLSLQVTKKNGLRLLGHTVGQDYLGQVTINNGHTICPGSSDPFYIVSYYIKWVTTSWTHGIVWHAQ